MQTFWVYIQITDAVSMSQLLPHLLDTGLLRTGQGSPGSDGLVLDPRNEPPYTFALQGFESSPLRMYVSLTEYFELS